METWKCISLKHFFKQYFYCTQEEDDPLQSLQEEDGSRIAPDAFYVKIKLLSAGGGGCAGVLFLVRCLPGCLRNRFLQLLKPSSRSRGRETLLLLLPSSSTFSVSPCFPLSYQYLSLIYLGPGTSLGRRYWTKQTIPVRRELTAWQKAKETGYRPKGRSRKKRKRVSSWRIDSGERHLPYLR